MTTPPAPATPSTAGVRPLEPHASTTAYGAPGSPEDARATASDALDHGLRAGRFVLLPHENAAEFRALVEALRRVHAPADTVELLYVDAIAVAIWRELRADRLEAEAMSDVPPAEPERGFGSDLSTASARASLATIVRYRAAAQAEHRRALAMLKDYRRLRAETAGADGRPAQPVDVRPAQGARLRDAEPVAAVSTLPLGATPQPDRPTGLPEHPGLAVPAPLRATPRERDRVALEQRAKIRAQMARLAAAERARAAADPLAPDPASGMASPRPPDRRAA